MTLRGTWLAALVALGVAVVMTPSIEGQPQCPLFECPVCEGECDSRIVWSGPKYRGCCGEGVEPPCYDACREGECSSWTMDEGQCTHLCASRCVVRCDS